MHNPSEAMTVWGLVSEASLLVQAVMLVLVLASLLSWYLIVQREAALRRSERECRDFLRRFRGDGDLEPLYRDGLADDETAGEGAGGLGRIFRAGYRPYLQLGREPGAGDAAIEVAERRMLAAIAEQEERLQQGLPVLATIGSVSPYVGLFGTVWGIMNSFIGLSQVQQATLSTVAPGIAEALIATAIGLFAAIPAVVAYNRFSARVSTLIGRYYGFGNELQGRLYSPTSHGL